MNYTSLFVSVWVADFIWGISAWIWTKWLCYDPTC